MKERYTKMKNKLFILLLTAFIAITFIVGCEYGKMHLESPKMSDTVFNTKVDTFWKDTVIRQTKYIPKRVEVIRTDTITKDTILTVEQKTYEDTLCNDKDSIILQSFITGQNVTKDSIKANWKKQETIVTNTVTITKYIEKKKTFWDKFHFGVQAGYGYTFKSKDLQPYVGIGGSIDL